MSPEPGNQPRRQSGARYRNFVQAIFADLAQGFAPGIARFGTDPLNLEGGSADVEDVAQLLGVPLYQAVEYARDMEQDYPGVKLLDVGGENLLVARWNDLPEKYRQSARHLARSMPKERRVSEITTSGDAGAYDLPLGAQPYWKRRRRKKKKKRKVEQVVDRLVEQDTGDIDYGIGYDITTADLARIDQILTDAGIEVVNVPRRFDRAGAHPDPEHDDFVSTAELSVRPEDVGSAIELLAPEFTILAVSTADGFIQLTKEKTGPSERRRK